MSTTLGLLIVVHSNVSLCSSLYCLTPSSSFQLDSFRLARFEFEFSLIIYSAICHIKMVPVMLRCTLNQFIPVQLPLSFISSLLLFPPSPLGTWNNSIISYDSVGVNTEGDVALTVKVVAIKQSQSP